MELALAVVGRASDAALGAAISEYERRAGRYWPLTVREVKEASGRSASPAVTRRQEGERLLESCLPRGDVVACDERGAVMTSADFAAWLGRLRDTGGAVTFVIGGAFGLDDAVRARATKLLAVAPWTLPHEMARLVLTEQLYRAGTILRGEPYHK
ncbi:MAG TPA: 23S rRNA (pseudouridine(1915)-N(3))-methyltransferase RlmH [Gemmatimonadaceae bacterium]|nr:23S rRNA (pseudouridine(1915)-N(3))-methyltransferase RlmH [Gemmatimonadaceae bacterium]